MMVCAGCFAPSLNRTSPFLSLILKLPFVLACRNSISPVVHYRNSLAAKGRNINSFNMGQRVHFCTKVLAAQESVAPSSVKMSNKSKKKARYEAPESVLKHKLDMCSKHGDLPEALRLYEEARSNGVQLTQHHYNVLLYLCSSAKVNPDGDGAKSSNSGLRRGFDIFNQMVADNVKPNEATFTSAARLAVAMDDPDMAFDMVKQMKAFGITPRLRSYGPALFGFCNKGNADKAYEVDAHMIESGVAPEEPELSALLKVSAEGNKSEKVYEMLQRLRATVRQASESTARVIEDWFRSAEAAKVGVKTRDVRKIREGISRGGGGWHGQGWLGNGKWKVVRTQMDENGVCDSCGDRLVCIDIDPIETENFAASLTKLARERANADFNQFQEWLEKHGPFDAVIDGANVGLVRQDSFKFSQLNNVFRQLQQISPSKKPPLVILHRGRVNGGPAQNPKNKQLLERWKKSGALYATPPGSNDDWYWLYAAVTCKCLLVTNDEMRDHLFQLLGNSFFPRWKEKHQVRLSVSREGGLKFLMPPPYSIVIQESENGSWHVPTTNGDDLETPRQWLCLTRSREKRSQ